LGRDWRPPSEFSHSAGKLAKQFKYWRLEKFKEVDQFRKKVKEEMANSFTRHKGCLDIECGAMISSKKTDGEGGRFMRTERGGGNNEYTENVQKGLPVY